MCWAAVRRGYLPVATRKEIATMFGSWKVGKLFGIDTFVHGTFWLLPLFVLFNGQTSEAIGLRLAVLFSVFGCVVLHELGHALAARMYGIGTVDITLYPIGGIARLEGMPKTPGREIVVALAGPLVNVVIAVGLFLWILAAGGWSTPGLDLFDLLLDLLHQFPFVGRLLIANVFLVAFNLLPAFPMDGGRVFRALLSLRLSRVRATEVAVSVSGLMALAFFGFGLYLPSLSLMILAVAVFLMGKAELAQVRWAEAQHTWNARLADLYQPIQTEPDGFSGWRYDPARRAWTEWHDGVVVREVPDP